MFRQYGKWLQIASSLNSRKAHSECGLDYERIDELKLFPVEAERIERFGQAKNGARCRVIQEPYLVYTHFRVALLSTLIEGRVEVDANEALHMT